MRWSWRWRWDEDDHWNLNMFMKRRLVSVAVVFWFVDVFFFEANQALKRATSSDQGQKQLLSHHHYQISPYLKEKEGFLCLTLQPDC